MSDFTGAIVHPYSVTNMHGSLDAEIVRFSSDDLVYVYRGLLEFLVTPHAPHKRDRYTCLCPFACQLLRVYLANFVTRDSFRVRNLLGLTTCVRTVSEVFSALNHLAIYTAAL